MTLVDSNAEAILQLVFYLIISIGYFKIFEKCGVKGIWAFVPIVRDYKIAVCADMEEEGRNYVLMSLLLSIINAISYFGTDKIQLMLLVDMAFVAVLIAYVIYEIRIYNGLVKNFDRKKDGLSASFC